jgi:murein DD-endopeptidase MepM/ murein hydrolase activator NlpD
MANQYALSRISSLSERWKKNLTGSILRGMGIQGIRGPQLPPEFGQAAGRTNGPGFAQALQKAGQAKDDSCCLQRPVPGQVLRSFAPGHPGIDLQAKPGDTVQAAAEGTVESAGWVGGYGNLLVVRHRDNERAYYAHLQQSQVRPGDQVQAGQPIALSGDTGATDQPHLHFELRRGGRPIDPLTRMG